MYKRYENILDEIEFKKCVSSLINGWSWGASTFGENVEQFRFWSLNLKDDDFFAKHMFNKILKLTGDNLTLDRLYANGQTYGLPGKFHQDSPDDSAMTFLFYANNIWHPEWGGDTLIADEHGTIHHSPAIPNTGIYFKGNSLHCGSEPTRHCKDLRVTVAFKMTRH